MRRTQLVAAVTLGTLLCLSALSVAGPIQNPSFETGDLTPGWEAGGYGLAGVWVTNSEPHSHGSYHAELWAAEPAGAGGLISMAFMRQTFDVPDLAQNLSFDVAAWSNSGDYWYDVNADLTGDGFYISFPGMAGIGLSYQTFTQDISIARGKTATLEFRAYTKGEAMPTDIYMLVDNVVITNVPEPTTLGLLTVGLMLLLRARRRGHWQ